MALFQDKIGWKRLRKRENKNFRSVSFLLATKQKVPKKQQKIQQTEKYHYGLISSQYWLEKAEKERK